MTLLRRTLRWQAVLWAGLGLCLLLTPGWLVEAALDQPPVGETTWLRITGALSIALSAQMVLVGHRIEELWWWSWTFALLQVATSLLFLLNALFGLPDGVAAWPWWSLAATAAVIGVVEVAAITKTGTERSPA